MYSPDGFASLVCLMRGECFFLRYQSPFVYIMNLLHGNFIAFFALQALIWLGLIIGVYFLAKTLRINHLFITPFLLLFSCSFFVDNFVGNFENDFIAIFLFVWSMVFWFGENKILYKLVSMFLVLVGSCFWFWFGYFRLPVLWSGVVEEMWLAQILGWGLLLGVYFVGIIFVLQNKFFNDKKLIGVLLFLSFVFPKLWFLAIPGMLLILDFVIKKFITYKNFKFFITILIFSLILGQVLRVGLFTFEAWNYPTNSKCYTVDHEYLARLKGISLNYNQASIYEYNKCLINEGLPNGT